MIVAAAGKGRGKEAREGRKTGEEIGKKTWENCQRLMVCHAYCIEHKCSDYLAPCVVDFRLPEFCRISHRKLAL